jgi:anaerobic nitric oxide reductase transcription regulator
MLTTMDKLKTLAAIATDLTAVLSAEDRYQRLLDALHIAIPYDAAALLRVEGEALIPLAANGLTPDAMGRKYLLKNHPRFDIICSSDEPVFFSEESGLPDPFDGMLIVDKNALKHIHACLGCPLYISGKLVGILVADAIDPKAFSNLPKKYVMAIGAMAGAQMQTADLFEALEKKAVHQGQLASDLMQDIHLQRGRKILGNSKAIKQLRKEIELIAKSDFTILIAGETGVGKELVARSVYSQSRRSDKPLLYLNCASLPDTLAESELFGHVKGAFTGAVSDRTGKFELSDGGTLFLDEIGELSLEIQAKILRVIQEGEVQRVGSEKMIFVDVRLIAATNRDLKEEVQAGRFRADLYHRLNVYPVTTPPLRERKDDIAILAGYFVEKSSVQLGLTAVQIGDDALRLLLRYNWPGNVRELKNVISRSVLKASFGSKKNEAVIILPKHLSGDFDDTVYPDPASANTSSFTVSDTMSFREELKLFRIRLIKSSLMNNNGNWAAAARDLNMNRSNLHNLATRLGLREKKKLT